MKKMITFKLDNSKANTLDYICKSIGISRSSYICLALNEYTKKNYNENKEEYELLQKQPEEK